MSEIEHSQPESDLGNLQNQLETQRRQLALLSQDKQVFFDCLSTELRTPINSILILANLLEQNASGNLTQKQIEYASVIQNSANDLLSIINELLEISQLSHPATKP